MILAGTDRAGGSGGEPRLPKELGLVPAIIRMERSRDRDISSLGMQRSVAEN